MKARTYITGNATDTGRKREENQDYFGAYEGTPYGDLWVVCDGMGGASGGRLASILAVEAVRDAVASPALGNEVSALLAAVADANAKVFEKAQSDPTLNGMGTTLVGLLIHKGKAYVAHIGDSRAYLLRDETLRQLTTDHTMVQEMLDGGLLTPEQARAHPDGHIITRCVGIGPQVEVDVDLEGFEVRAGDRWVLCTDGLTGQVSDELLHSIAGDLSPAKACRTLVTLANESGGPDNITVQVVEVRKRRVRLRRRPTGKRQKLGAARAGLLAGAGVLVLSAIAAVLWLTLPTAEVTSTIAVQEATEIPVEDSHEEGRDDD